MALGSGTLAEFPLASWGSVSTPPAPDPNPQRVFYKKNNPGCKCCKCTCTTTCDGATPCEVRLTTSDGLDFTLSINNANAAEGGMSYNAGAIPEFTYHGGTFDTVLYLYNGPVDGSGPLQVTFSHSTLPDNFIWRSDDIETPFDCTQPRLLPFFVGTGGTPPDVLISPQRFKKSCGRIPECSICTDTTGPSAYQIDISGFAATGSGCLGCYIPLNGSYTLEFIKAEVGGGFGYCYWGAYFGGDVETPCHMNSPIGIPGSLFPYGINAIRLILTSVTYTGGWAYQADFLKVNSEEEFFDKATGVGFATDYVWHTAFSIPGDCYPDALPLTPIYSGNYAPYEQFAASAYQNAITCGATCLLTAIP